MNSQAVLRGALRQQTAFTLVLLAMERFTMVYDDDDADNHHHSYDGHDDNDDDHAGTSDKSTLRRVSLSSHPPSVFSIQVGISNKFCSFLFRTSSQSIPCQV